MKIGGLMKFRDFIVSRWQRRCRGQREWGEASPVRRSRRALLRLAPALLLPIGAVLGGCGQKGPLYFPPPAPAPKRKQDKKTSAES